MHSTVFLSCDAVQFGINLLMFCSSDKLLSHCVTLHKNALFIITSMRISNVTFLEHLCLLLNLQKKKKKKNGGNNIQQNSFNLNDMGLDKC